MTAPSSPVPKVKNRIGFRPPALENAWLLGTLSVFAAIFVLLGFAAHTWTKGATEIVYWAILVFAFGVFPWIYVQTSLLWVNSDQIGLRYGIVRRTVSRNRLHRVVGTVGRICFLDPHGRTLLNAPRFWSDDQVGILCTQLGIRPEGTAKYLSG